MLSPQRQANRARSGAGEVTMSEQEQHAAKGPVERPLGLDPEHDLWDAMGAVR